MDTVPVIPVDVPKPSSMFEIPKIGKPTIFKLFVATVATYGLCRLSVDLNSIMQKAKLNRKPCCPTVPGPSTKRRGPETCPFTASQPMPAPVKVTNFELEDEMVGVEEVFTDLLVGKVRTEEPSAEEEEKKQD